MIEVMLYDNVTEEEFWPRNRRNYSFTKFEAYIYLLIQIDDGEGSFPTSILSLSKEWNWSRSKVRKFLNRLSREEKIEITKDNNITYIKGVSKDTEKTTNENMVENTIKDNEKDIKKDTIKVDKTNTSIDDKDTLKNMEKHIAKDHLKNKVTDTEKDTEEIKENLDMNSVIDIIKM